MSFLGAGSSSAFSRGNNNDKDNKPSEFLFGGTPATSSASATSGLFGAASSTPKPVAGSSLFGGGGTSTPPISTSGFPFGGAGSTPSSTPAPGGGLFANNKPASGGLFGAATSSTPTSTPNTTVPKPTMFGVDVSFGGNTGGVSSTPTSQPISSMFGATGTQAKPAANLFGGSPTLSTTPATSSGGLLNTKPATSAPASGALFGNALSTSAPSGGLFGNASATSGASSTPQTAPFGQKLGGGGGGLFGPAASTTPAAKPPGSPFGGASSTPAAPAPTTGGSSLFSGAGSSKPAAVAGGLFGNASTPASTQVPSSTSTGLFGGGASSNATPASTAAPAASGTTSSLFGGPATSKPAETSAQPSLTGSLFGAKPATTSPAPTPSATTFSGGLFGAKPATSSPAATPGTTASSSATTTTTAPTSGGLFGSAITGTAAAPSTATPSFDAKATQPPPQSRLKNKSMEEIINRWTSDLEKYKAEFVAQASEVKQWDAVLIENGDKLVNLLSETIEAEKTQARMDTVLQQLENEQEELGTALDYYESQIKDFFEAQFGSTDGMQPADQEREKTYSLAEQLNETLITMEGDLGEMIKAINTASATINKTSNADGPLSQIVKILNDHLSSLQWIDTHTTQVSEKIQEALNKNDRSSANLGGEDDFFPNMTYRSMR